MARTGRSSRLRPAAAGLIVLLPTGAGTVVAQLYSSSTCPSSLGYCPGHPEPQRWASPLVGAVSSRAQQACRDWPGRKEISFCLMIQAPRCLTVLAGAGNKTICHVIAEQTVCKELPRGRHNVLGLPVLLIRLKTWSMILHPHTGSGMERFSSQYSFSSS